MHQHSTHAPVTGSLEESILKRKNASTLALAATFLLTNVKMVVAVFTGSVGVLSETIHSGLDLLSSLVTFFVVRASGKPADLNHPFGHGKIESISALFEAFLLFVAGGYIVFEGVRAWANSDSHHIHNTGWGIAALGGSIVVNLFVYLQNRKVAREHESIAIETNAFHFLTDMFSSLAVFVSLIIVQYTGWVWVDALVAVVIAAYITVVGIQQMRKCIAELSDTALPDDEVGAIAKAIEKHKSKFVNYHDLRTRKSGAKRHVDFHLEICSEDRVARAHAVCDEIEDDLMKQFKETDVNIHVEPCGHHEAACEKVCLFYRKDRSEVARSV